MEQTKLQKIIEQKADQIRGAIEQAIDDGAIIEKNLCVSGIVIDGVYVGKYEKEQKPCCVVLKFESEKITQVFEPSKAELYALVQKKRAEIEEIKKQIKEKEEKDEHDRN